MNPPLTSILGIEGWYCTCLAFYIIVVSMLVGLFQRSYLN